MKGFRRVNTAWRWVVFTLSKRDKRKNRRLCSRTFLVESRSPWRPGRSFDPGSVSFKLRMQPYIHTSYKVSGEVVWTDRSSSSDREAWTGPKRKHGAQPPHPGLRHSHDPTSPSIHEFLAGGKGDSRLWQGLPGAIHNLDPSIHNLVHEIWQGKGSNGDLLTEIAIFTVRSSAPLSTHNKKNHYYHSTAVHPPRCQCKHARNDGRNLGDSSKNQDIAISPVFPQENDVRPFEIEARHDVWLKSTDLGLLLAIKTLLTMSTSPQLLPTNVFV